MKILGKLRRTKVPVGDEMQSPFFDLPAAAAMTGAVIVVVVVDSTIVKSVDRAIGLHGTSGGISDVRRDTSL